MRDYERVKVAMRKYANGMRLKAIAKLGGRCNGTGYCAEDDPNRMYVVMMTREGRKWDQIKAYRRIIDSDRPNELARVLCKDCRESMRNEVKLVKANRRKAKISNKDDKITVYIAGQRVNKPISYDDTPDHLIDNIND